MNRMIPRSRYDLMETRQNQPGDIVITINNSAMITIFNAL